MTLSKQMGDRANLTYCLQGLAAVACAQGQAERSAVLFGAAEEVLEAVGAPVYNYHHPDPALYDRTQTDVRSQLGEAAFEEAWNQGRAMTVDQVVEYALEDYETSTS